MNRLGRDFSGGLLRRSYEPSNPGGLWYAIAVAVVLLVLHQVLQLVLATGLMFFMPQVTHAFIKAGLISIFPASLIILALAWWLAGLRGGEPRRVLSLRWPGLSPLGWGVVILCFMVAMYAAIAAIVTVFHIDMAQYTPGPDGKSPETGSAGAVKEAMYDIANEPMMFLAVFPAVALGAPLAEELIFRGQLFSALSSTRLGVAGATLVTALAWSLLHVTEPWLSIGLIFVMGLIFGYLMYRFGSLWVTIACHGIWNGFYAVLVFLKLGVGT